MMMNAHFDIALNLIHVHPYNDLKLRTSGCSFNVQANIRDVYV